jgi:imidazolonepropionase-like amidohydrolase
MRKTVAAAAAVIVTAALSALGGGPGRHSLAAQSGSVVIFEGARVIPGDGRPAIEDAAMLVRDGVIAQVGRRAEMKAPAGAQRVDVNGKTVMPLLLNVHGHIGYLKGTSVDAANYSRANILDHLRRLEYFGVAAFQSLGTDRDDLELRMRDEQRAGTLAAGVRLFTAGDGIVAPNAGSPNGGPGFATDVVREAATPEQARTHVRALAAKKVDVVKVWVDDRNGTKAKLPPAIYQAAIAEARRLGARVLAHVYTLEDARGLAAAGVDGFAHPVRDRNIDRELIDVMKAKDIFQCSTMGVHENGVSGVPVDDPALAETLSAADISALRETARRNQGRNVEAARQIVDHVRRNLKALHDAGVRITLCGDTGIAGQFFGFAEHRELEFLVAAGLTPLDTIRAATATPAQVLRLDGLGTLAPGKRADFLVLDGNPLERITDTRRIAAVYRSGRAVDRAAMRRAWADAPGR